MIHSRPRDDGVHTVVEPPAGARAGVMRLTPGLVPALLEALGSDFAVDVDLAAGGNITHHSSLFRFGTLDSAWSRRADGEIRSCQNWFTTRMKAFSVKLPEEMIRRLKAEARASGRSVSSLIRDRLEHRSHDEAESVHAVAADLAGSVAGSRRSATNERRKFRRG